MRIWLVKILKVYQDEKVSKIAVKWGKAFNLYQIVSSDVKIARLDLNDCVIHKRKTI